MLQFSFCRRLLLSLAAASFAARRCLRLGLRLVGIAGCDDLREILGRRFLERLCNKEKILTHNVVEAEQRVLCGCVCGCVRARSGPNTLAGSLS